MLQSKSFVKKTKQGRLQKVCTRQHHHLARPPQTLADAVALSPQVVREHYLRDDIYCGFVPCSVCDAAAERKLAAAAAAILVVDTNVVLHQVSKAFFSLLLSLLVGYKVEGVD
jgi:exosome complex exonuclease DIS3/RRP44